MAAMAAKKRPRRECRRWFAPDARVGDRQRTCSRDECQAARREATQASWRARHPEYDRGNRTEGSGTRPARPCGGPPLSDQRRNLGRSVPPPASAARPEREETRNSGSGFRQCRGETGDRGWRLGHIETPDGSVRARARLNDTLQPDVVCGQRLVAAVPGRGSARLRAVQSRRRELQPHDREQGDRPDQRVRASPSVPLRDPVAGASQRPMTAPPALASCDARAAAPWADPGCAPADGRVPVSRAHEKSS